MIPVFAPTLFMPQPASAVTVTFDPGTKSANIVLSNGDLTAANPTGTGENFAYSNVTGTKFYFEVVINDDPTATNNDVGIGIADASFTGGSFLGSDTHSVSAFDGGAIFYNGGGGTNWAAGGAFAGDNCSCAVDMGNGLFWARKNGGNWNNSGTANPATATGGLSIALSSPVKAAIDLRQVTGNQVTANFASTSWTYTAPAGFSQLT